MIEPELSENVISSQKTETESHVNLIWKMKSVPKACVFERPDGESFSPMEGVLHEGYQYFGEGINFNECGISIPKPLTHKDIGFWKFMAFLPESNQVYQESQENQGESQNQRQIGSKIAVGFLNTGNSSLSGMSKDRKSFLKIWFASVIPFLIGLVNIGDVHNNRIVGKYKKIYILHCLILFKKI